MVNIRKRIIDNNKEFGKDKEEIAYLKQAWLVHWNFYNTNGSDDDLNKKLDEYGIKNRIVNILSTRKSYDKDIIEIAKDIYQQTILYPSEKIQLANYNTGKKLKDKMFNSSIPLFTIYKSDLYQKLIKEIEKDNKSKESIKLLDQWKRYPQCVIVGHNPSLEIIKVKNIVVYKNRDGTEIIEWDRPLIDSNNKHESYEWR